MSLSNDPEPVEGTRPQACDFPTVTTFATATPTQAADAMNRVFSGYLVPVAFSPEQLELHITCNDIDPARSPLWYDDHGNVIAAALLGVRGNRAWIGGFGVAPEYRKQGYAKRLLDAIIETARSAALTSIALEVLRDNTAAIRLYQSAGFTAIRQLHSFEIRIDGADMPPGYAYDDPDRLIRYPDAVRPCWQREPRALERGAVSTAIADKSGNFAIYRFNQQTAQVFKLRAKSTRDLSALARAIASDRAAGSVLILNEPEESPIVSYARATAWTEPFTQYEMRLPLSS